MHEENTLLVNIEVRGPKRMQTIVSLDVGCSHNYQAWIIVDVCEQRPHQTPPLAFCTHRTHDMLTCLNPMIVSLLCQERVISPANWLSRSAEDLKQNAISPFVFSLSLAKLFQVCLSIVFVLGENVMGSGCGSSFGVFVCCKV